MKLGKRNVDKMISEEDQKLFESFFHGNEEDFPVNGSIYTHFEGIVVIKKIIIYLIMILDNLNLFVKVKTNSKINYEPVINLNISKKNEEIIRKKIEDKKRYKNMTFDFDKSLIYFSVLELIKKIKIEDILMFLKISQLNFLIKNPKIEKYSNGCRTKTIYLKLDKKSENESKKSEMRSESNEINSMYSENSNNTSKKMQSLNNYENNSQNLNDNPDGVEYYSHKSGNSSNINKLKTKKKIFDPWIQFTMREYEIDEIILAKRKRPDEELKHSFKAVRKGIDKMFKEKMLIDSESENNEKNTNNLFEDNPDLAIKYKNPNITKEVVANLKKCDNFVEQMNNYIENSFLKDEIENNVINKQEEIMKKNLTLKEFLLALMTKQKKNGWIVQNILNSLDVLENCTEDTIMKKKGKKTKKEKKPKKKKKEKEQINIDIKSTKKNEKRKYRDIYTKFDEEEDDSNDIYISSK